MAACSGKPFVRSDSYDSSRCAASSACTSSVSAESRARPERRWRTSSCQSGMGHLLEPPQCSEQFRALRRLKRSEEHTSELQSHLNLVCRLLLEKKKSAITS